jgi:hypothetical protein
MVLGDTDEIGTGLARAVLILGFGAGDTVTDGMFAEVGTGAEITVCVVAIGAVPAGTCGDAAGLGKPDEVV